MQLIIFIIISPFPLISFPDSLTRPHFACSALTAVPAAAAPHTHALAHLISLSNTFYLLLSLSSSPAVVA